MIQRAAAAALLLLAGCTSWPGTSGAEDALVVASWNLEHLAERDGSGCRPRSEPDYAQLRRHLEAVDPDVVAIQEVESVAAAYRVFDPAEYVVVLETRPGGGAGAECRGLQGLFLNRQAVGFAIRRSLRFERHADYEALSLGDPNLRSGVDVTIFANSGPIRLLAVHLKSGCSSGQTGEACDTLFQQVPVVERWGDQRADEGAPFAILGDFNRRLSSPADPVWAEWDDGDPVEADLALAAGPAPATCDPRYPSFIDHIVLSRNAAERLTGFREVRYDGDRLSDHCLIVAELR